MSTLNALPLGGQWVVYGIYTAYGLMALFLVARPWRRFLLGVVSIALGFSLLGYSSFPFFAAEPWQGWLSGLVKVADAWPGPAFGLSPRIQAGLTAVLVGGFLLESSSSVLKRIAMGLRSLLEGSLRIVRRPEGAASKQTSTLQREPLSVPISTLRVEEPPQEVLTQRASPLPSERLEKLTRTAVSVEPSSTIVAGVTSTYLTHILQIQAGQRGRLKLDSLRVGEAVEVHFAVEKGKTRDIGFRIQADNGGCVVDLPQVSGEYGVSFAVPVDADYTMFFDNRSSGYSGKTVNVRYRVYWNSALSGQTLGAAGEQQDARWWPGRREETEQSLLGNSLAKVA